MLHRIVWKASSDQIEVAGLHFDGESRLVLLGFLWSEYALRLIANLVVSAILLF
jgi:hypothetical protein